MQVTCIEIEAVRYLIPGEIQVNQAIVVEIPGCDATTVVIIQVGENVKLWGGLQRVVELDSRVLVPDKKLFRLFAAGKQ